MDEDQIWESQQMAGPEPTYAFPRLPTKPWRATHGGYYAILPENGAQVHRWRTQGLPQIDATHFETLNEAERALGLPLTEVEDGKSSLSRDQRA
jgi:hypothetical protein